MEMKNKSNLPPESELTGASVDDILDGLIAEFGSGAQTPPASSAPEDFLPETHTTEDLLPESFTTEALLPESPAGKAPAPTAPLSAHSEPEGPRAEASAAPRGAGFAAFCMGLLKYAAALCAAAFILFQCMQTGRVSSAPMESVAEATRSAVSLSSMQQADARMLRRLYGLDPSQLDGWMLYYPADNMDAEELLLVKLCDLSQKDLVVSAMQARKSAQMTNFDGYGVEQYDMLSKGIIDVQGNYVLFVVHADADAACQAFENAL